MGIDVGCITGFDLVVKVAILLHDARRVRECVRDRSVDEVVPDVSRISDLIWPSRWCRSNTRDQMALPDSSLIDATSRAEIPDAWALPPWGIARRGAVIVEVNEVMNITVANARAVVIDDPCTTSLPDH